MSWLALVRHAQASFDEDHYDQLSPLGERQACLLGEAWVRQRREVTDVYTGPRSRQRQTAQIVGACYRAARLPFPEVVVLEELDEYDLTGILDQLAPSLANRDADFARLCDGQRQGATQRERERSFQAMFEPLLRHWQMDAEAIPGLETWSMFTKRVKTGLMRMTCQPGRSRRVAAFTSGGFIGVAVQQILAAPNSTALELNWRIRNAAVTEFVYSGDRITLDVFNNVTHFEESELVTYR
jgi:broad specificity phosphatase PhoE